MEHDNWPLEALKVYSEVKVMKVNRFLDHKRLGKFIRNNYNDLISNEFSRIDFDTLRHH